jgi:hypothetical protein
MKNKILNVEITSEEQRNELIKQLQEMEFKKELPKSWGELEILKGFWIDDDSDIRTADMDSYSETDKNVFKTEKQAKKALAMSQLSQLMAVYNDDWKPDWSSPQDKYAIYRYGNNIVKTSWCFNYSFLAFPDELTRDAFFTNFQPLIKQFFELDDN